MLLHASCVSIGGKGVLLLGESGSGKSDLALRLIDRDGQLVADDQVHLTPPFTANAPEKLKGLLELRGVGILNLPYVTDIPLVLAVQLVSRNEVERLPEPALWGCLGAELPLLSLHAFDASTPAKIRFYVSQLFM